MKTFTGPAETLAGCGGTYVLAVRVLDGGWTYPECPGCNDCDRDLVRTRMAAAGKFNRDPFAGLPVEDERPW